MTGTNVPTSAVARYLDSSPPQGSNHDIALAVVVPAQDRWDSTVAVPYAIPVGIAGPQPNNPASGTQVVVA